MSLRTSLDARRGKGISDEDEESYILGYRDALRDLLSDETYYGALNAAPSHYDALQRAVEANR